MEVARVKNSFRPIFEPEILGDGSSPDVDVAPQLEGVLQDVVHVKQVGLEVVAFAGVKKFGPANQVLEFANSKLGHDSANLKQILNNYSFRILSSFNQKKIFGKLRLWYV